MKNNFQKQREAFLAKPGEKSTYDPRLDVYSGKVLFPAKLAEANKVLALWDFKSFREEFERERRK